MWALLRTVAVLLVVAALLLADRLRRHKRRNHHLGVVDPFAEDLQQHAVGPQRLLPLLGEVSVVLRLDFLAGAGVAVGPAGLRGVWRGLLLLQLLVAATGGAVSHAEHVARHPSEPLQAAAAVAASTGAAPGRRCARRARVELPPELVLPGHFVQDRDVVARADGEAVAVLSATRVGDDGEDELRKYLLGALEEERGYGAG